MDVSSWSSPKINTIYIIVCMISMIPYSSVEKTLTYMGIKSNEMNLLKPELNPYIKKDLINSLPFIEIFI